MFALGFGFGRPIKGDQGDRGLPGFAGDDGIDGLPGHKGDQGTPSIAISRTVSFFMLKL